MRAIYDFYQIHYCLISILLIFISHLMEFSQLNIAFTENKVVYYGELISFVVT